MDPDFEAVKVILDGQHDVLKETRTAAYNLYRCSLV